MLFRAALLAREGTVTARDVAAALGAEQSEPEAPGRVLAELVAEGVLMSDGRKGKAARILAMVSSSM